MPEANVDPNAGAPVVTDPAKAPAPAELTFGEIQDKAVTALEAWKDNPSNETFEAAKEASIRAKGAVEKVKTDAAEVKTKADADAKVAADEAARNKPPENYDFKVPDKSLLTEAQIGKIAAYAKEQGFSQEKAQLVLEARNEVLAEFVIENSPDGAAWNKRVEGWEAESLADPELGAGNAETLTKHSELGKRVLAKYFDETVVEELIRTGYGSHPGMMRGFVRIGKELGDDVIHSTGPAPGSKKPIEEVFYPSNQGAAK